MDSSEHVELSLEELHSMSISLGWNVALFIHLPVLEIRQAELPQIVHSILSVLASEEVDILPIRGSRATASRSWQSVVNFVSWFGTREQCADFVLGDAVLVDRIEIFRFRSVVPTNDRNLLLISIRNVDAAEGVDLWEYISFRL